MNPMSQNGGQSMIPQVLQQNGSTDENQDTILTTVRLEPNASSQISSVFILPKSGSVLDSNSSLVWSVAWDQFNPAQVLNGAAGPLDQAVIPKTFSGCLNSIRRARMYVGGRLLFENPDVALIAHIHKLSTNPDHYQEVEDCKLGSQHGVQIEGIVDLILPENRGKYQTGTDGWIASGNGVGGVANPTPAVDRNDQLNRVVGSYSLVPVSNFSWEATLLLSDVFPALKHLQLPVKFLKDECRIEIDWETNFNETLNPVSNVVNALTIGNQTLSIQNPLLYLDYLTYNEEVEAGLAMASQNGIVIPYREMNLISKQLPSSNTTNDSQDIFLGFQGKLLMKIYVSHRFANTGVTVVNPTAPLSGVMAYQAFQGRCRSDMGENMKYNLIINDLHIHDAKVNTASQQYSYLSMTAENPIFAFPNSFDFNSIYNRTANNGGAPGGPAASDISSSNYEVGGRLVADTNNGASASNIRDGIMGTQAFIGFDLSKYGVEGGLNAANAGFRVGSTPIILNIEQDGGIAASRQLLPKQVDVICESIKMLQIRNGMVDVMDS
tara:strand:- start:364 stop:2016 length:1653 start_codon:yes stop_codon:yes gene_type:complete